MKKIISLLLAFSLLLSFTACSNSQANSSDNETNNTESNTIIQPDSIEIKTSPDKYTWYVKNYVGKNLASVGYTSMGGDRMDSYGNGYIQLVLLTINGEYVDIESEEELKVMSDSEKGVDVLTDILRDKNKVIPVLNLREFDLDKDLDEETRDLIENIIAR